MTCGDIPGLLKGFQEDMLLEEDYQAFVRHVEACAKCKEYVQSIDFLSNQLWELGNVTVPSDLNATIFFELKRPRATGSKKLLWGCVSVVGVLLALLIGVTLVRALKESAAGPSRVPGEVGVKPRSAADTQSSVPDTLKRRVAETYQHNEVPSWEGEATIVYHYILGEPTKKSEKAVVTTMKSLHWHLELPEGSSGEEQTASGFEVGDRLLRKMVEKERLEREIKNAEEENQAGFRRPYSEKEKKDASEQKKQREDTLETLRAQARSLDSDVRSLREETNQLEVSARERAVGYLREKAQLKVHLSNVLIVSGIRLDYDSDGMVIFTASGRKIEQVLERIMSEYARSSSFHDFTKEVSVPPAEESRVCLYLTESGAWMLHWHIEHAEPSQKSHLLELIGECGGSIHFKSTDTVVFSIPISQIEGLRRRIQATRLPLSEYGDIKSDRNVLVSKPVVVSVYFSA